MRIVTDISMTAALGAFRTQAPRTRARGWVRLVVTALAGFIVPLLALLLWQVSASRDWLPQQILPPPDMVWQSFVDMVKSGELLGHIEISLQRVVEGFALGAVIGLTLGFSIGLSPILDDYLSPLITAFAQVPTLGWVPLLMILLGIDEGLKVAIIAIAAFIPMVINTRAAVRAVPQGLLEVARCFMYTRRQQLLRVVLPASVPTIFTGIRYGLTHAWKALVGVELLASAEGLGYLLVWGRQMFWLDMVLLAMAVIGVLGFAMDYGLARIERRLQRWRIGPLGDPS
ncbi:sulfonate transport system permease protein [Arboricoccus pini]|uniref:Sulfonate transport system permease protein n=1 Tax=Arboricoccus pini TaxID=1963835 RepID=A0A212RFV3_9PROT|nr:ABC transporter permease [Arboricoccus pini]SNB71103.1 sulfonate transport system permease protein [Arboricoccus pini]